MGNCLSYEPKTKEEPTLQELKYLDRQQGHTPIRDGPRHSAASSHPRMDPLYPPPGVVPAGYVPGMYPAYGGYPAIGYPVDHSGLYYQPRGPMLILDPYGYELGEDGYELSYEGERRHHRKKKDRDRSSKHAKKDHDDDDDSEKDADNRKDDHKRSRKRDSEKVQQNGGPVRASSSAVVQAAAASSAPRPRQKPANYVPRDVMISYSRTDHAVMTKIKDALEAAGLTVWVDVSDITAGGDFLSMIGEAIIDAKLFVCILSEQAVKSKYCRDEVALAYVSNTAIFPVNLIPKQDLVATMDTGLKLQLAGYKWTSLEDSDRMEENIGALVANMKAEMDKIVGDGVRTGANSGEQSATAADGTASPDAVDVNVGGGSGGDAAGGSPQQSPRSETGPPNFKHERLREVNREAAADTDEGYSHVMPEQFWSDRFGTSDYVDWDRFMAGLLDEFRDPVAQTFSADDVRQLTEILRREMEVDDDNKLYKYQFMTFCSQQGEPVSVWQRVKDQARESFAMREVFSMDSSVRVEAIENLGKFRSAAVIGALRDLLTDPDANVRAVATVSLARTDASDPVTIRHIMRMLTDKDRLVREAGCLALGHLKARQAVSKLTHIWRNDVISHVREAAAAALRQIGGQEVENVMRVTRVLAEEIRTLTDME